MGSSAPRGGGNQPGRNAIKGWMQFSARMSKPGAASDRHSRCEVGTQLCARPRSAPGARVRATAFGRVFARGIQGPARCARAERVGFGVGSGGEVILPFQTRIPRSGRGEIARTYSATPEFPSPLPYPRRTRCPRLHSPGAPPLLREGRPGVARRSRPHLCAALPRGGGELRPPPPPPLFASHCLPPPLVARAAPGARALASMFPAA